MATLFNPSTPAITKAPAAPTPMDPMIQQMVAAREAQAGLAAGRSSTILTSGWGDTTLAPVQKKAMLGY